MTEPVLKVENLSKKYGDTLVWDQVNAQVMPGQVISIIGPSGAGKSTFLRCLNMLETPTSGKIFYHDQEVTQMKDKELQSLREHVGMVFQNFNLFANMSVSDNICLALKKVKGLDEAAAKDKALALLKQVGLADKADSYPSSLSGGQQQRVAIARSLAMDPEVILFDEPTSALDPEMVGDILKIMQELAEQGMTMVVVTHEMSFAKNVSDEIWFMADQQILEKGSPASFFQKPQTERAQDFLDKVLNL
ncbi:amino acid ABC transporter ATP-binding protein [Lactobacillus corticis]|uniref:Amino acid ABC transporter ATP-binding protein n=1 Tax=Lactobacillus corticis TaxID=2201249 RepID=A0A916QFD0_9LACO|nr:amino acid ABC transporter ATP-binding protein [Lactobacillus corticis]GFZ26270.1 amino acid ABC transporter ATP-binding protein [Lactobacillus corticis]